ncbi:MAG: hydrogenase formation protein HypD [Gammaproteobacteria bacterium]|nr:hydrogenase formation protein HypD [Gammaproteobacteria bacterium]MBU1625036.1 hydrogenase formation protein HypD [Gammaproteobacteria bacterium]MBU1981296.1 hydrogenase formation protein HypD [Gammaproteobacteria bacterium]
MLEAKDWLARIHALNIEQPMRIMNVCGGHERSISMAGLRTALPKQVQLIAGPGCPVCVCPEEDVYQAIQLAVHAGVILVAFGDMLRVPVNVAKGALRSLEQAKAAGADVRPIASPREAVQIAQQNPERQVVFFAAGFETTMAPVAAMLLEGVPDNLSLLLSGRLTWPAVAMLLDSGEAGFNALVAPGHVATVMGPEEWSFVVEQHHMPAAVAGFTPVSLLAAMYSVLRQSLEDKCFLDNCYPELVKPGGNPAARRLLAKAFDVTDANWRGIGIIPASGYALAPAYAAHDARLRFPAYNDTERKRAGQMPPGCDCARVVLGRIDPDACKLYGTACTPKYPVGPCMVSDEGACRIWWSTGVRAAVHD